MADENIGGVNVSITGDYSPLQAVFQEAQAAAQTAGANIAEAFDTGASGVSAFVSAIAEATDSIKGIDAAGAAGVAGLEGLGAAAAAADGELGGFSDAALDVIGKTQQLQDNVTEAAATLRELYTAYQEGEVSAEVLATAQGDLADAMKGISEHTGEAKDSSEGLLKTLLEFSGIAVSVETLKEFATEALETFAAVEKAEVAITALSGSAEYATQSIEGLKELAVSDALSFPQLIAADQKMLALGIDTAKIPGALRAAGDAAAATGNQFDSVAAAINRMALSGMASGRQLVALGLTTEDLAAAIGVSTGEMAAAFKAMDPTERVNAIIESLQKFSGVAQETADTISGQWQNLKTQAEFNFEAIGAAVAPAASALIKLSGVILSGLSQALQDISNQFKNFTYVVSQSVQPVVDLVQDLTGLQGFAGSAKDAIHGFADSFIYANSTIGPLIASIRTFTAALQLITGKDQMEPLIANLVRVEQAATNVTKATGDLAKQFQTAWSSVPHATDSLSLLSGALEDARANQEKVSAEFQKGTATYAQMIAANAGLESATKALADAQGPLPGTIDAIDAAARKATAGLLPLASSQDIAASSALAAKDKIALLTAQEIEAQQKVDLLTIATNDAKNSLDGSVGAYNNYRTLLEATVKAASDATAAHKALTMAQIDEQSAAHNAATAQQNFGVEILGVSPKVKEMSAALVDAQNTLFKVGLEQQAGIATMKQYEAAQKAVKAAQDALNAAQSESANSTGHATDQYSLLTQIVADQKVKLEQLTAAYQNDKATAEQVEAAKNALATAEKNLADFTKTGTEAQNDNNRVLGQVPAAANAAADAVRNNTSALNDNAAAAKSAASAQQSYTNVKNTQAYADANAEAKPADINIGAAPAHTHWDVQVTPGYLGGGATHANIVPDQGYTFDPGTGQAVEIPGYFDAARKAMGLLPATSTSAGSTSGAAATSVSSTAQASGAATPVPNNGSTDPIDLLQQSLVDANNALAAVTDEYHKGTATAQQVLSAQNTANSIQQQLLNATTSSVQATASAAVASTAVASVISQTTTAMQTLGVSVVALSATIAAAAKAPTNVASAGAVLGQIPSASSSIVLGGGGSNVVGQTTVINFHLQGAQFGAGMSAATVQNAFTQALRTAGARF